MSLPCSPNRRTTSFRLLLTLNQPHGRSRSAYRPHRTTAPAALGPSYKPYSLWESKMGSSDNCKRVARVAPSRTYL